MQTENNQEASRKGRFLTKTPPKLAILLDIVNSIPERLSFIHNRETLEAAMRGAAAEFRQFVAPDGLHTDQQIHESIKRLHEADKWRAALDSFGYLVHLEKGISYHYDEIPLAIYCDEQGVIKLKENLFTEAIKEGIDAAQLARCTNEKCQRLFFKGRKDQKTCSTACAKVLRTRKWREKTTPEQRQSYKIGRTRKKKD